MSILTSCPHISHMPKVQNRKEEEVWGMGKKNANQGGNEGEQPWRREPGMRERSRKEPGWMTNRIVGHKKGRRCNQGPGPGEPRWGRWLRGRSPAADWPGLCRAVSPPPFHGGLIPQLWLHLLPLLSINFPPPWVQSLPKVSAATQKWLSGWMPQCRVSSHRQSTLMPF